MKPTLLTINDTLKINIPSWAVVCEEKDKRFILENPDGNRLLIESVFYQDILYLKIGNMTYLVLKRSDSHDALSLENIHHIGNDDWRDFFQNVTPSDHFLRFPFPLEDGKPQEILRPFPANPTLHPSLLPTAILPPVIATMRKKLGEIFPSQRMAIDAAISRKISYRFVELLHYLVAVGSWGNDQDYHDTQKVLGTLQHFIEKDTHSSRLPCWGKDSLKIGEVAKIILSIKEYLLLRRTGVYWGKWRNIISCSYHSKEENSAKRNKTIFELEVPSSRVHITADLCRKDSRNADIKNWMVASVNALGEEDLSLLASEKDIETTRSSANKNPETGESYAPHSVASEIYRRAMVYGIGETLIENAAVVSLAFAGGSATTVKKVLGKNKLVHWALKVKTSSGNTRWISLLQARTGMIFGQHTLSNIVFVTNIESATQGESESSTLEFLQKEYAEELARDQISLVNQRSGFVVDTQKGKVIRYKDGSLAFVAENHLWAFLALLLDKGKVMNILRNTSGILSLGNGDNILNYPRAGMVGEIEYSRRLEGKPIASIALVSPSAGDKKGGFVARVTYKNRETGDTTTQVELREISEFPTREGSDFSATSIAKYDSFYSLAEKNGYFIEDIFQHVIAKKQRIAFNVAFYAVDLRLFVARIFGFSEKDSRLIPNLEDIDDQVWVDTMLHIGELVPSMACVDKTVPKEGTKEEVKGYMTEQMVQDFIINALALLKIPSGGSPAEARFRLAERKDFFLPYKGKKQHELDESGCIIVDQDTGKPKEEYDLIANQKRYRGVIAEHLQKNHPLILGSESVSDLIPIDFATLKEKNKSESAEERRLFCISQ